MQINCKVNDKELSTVYNTLTKEKKYIKHEYKHKNHYATTADYRYNTLFTHTQRDRHSYIVENI